MADIRIDLTREQDIPVEAFQSAVEDLYNLLIDLTPVDTGFCQSQWDLSLGEDDATISNSCEYSSFLDDGWSKQAPNGMTGPALDEFPSILAGYL